MSRKFANNATSTLAAGIDAVATAISLAAGDGAKFPVLGAGDNFALTIISSSGALEIVNVTARAGDVLTVVRGQEGTAAAAFAAGALAEHRLTAGSLAELQSPAVPGANKQVIINDADVLAGSDQLTFDKATGQLVIVPVGVGSSRGTVVLNANALAAADLPPVAHHFAFRVAGPDNGWGAIYIDNFGVVNDGIGDIALRSVIDLRAMRGTAAVPAASVAGDEFSRVSCRGSTSSGFTASVAGISAIASENFTATNQGAWLGFRTTPNGTVGGGSVDVPGISGAVTSNGAIIAGRGLFTSTAYSSLINRDPGNGMFLAEEGYQIRGGTDADYLTLQTAAGTGQPVIKLPFGSTDFTTTGAAHNVLMQTAAGAAFTVAQLAAGDISGLGSAALLAAGVANGAATLDSSGKLTAAQIPASLLGALQYQSAWNASTNTPAIASGVGTKGYYYKVSVAGTTAIDGISQWNIGDLIVFDGTVWDKFDGIANEVVSVAGLTGAITATALKGALSIAAGDVSGLAASATTDATNAANITSGTLPNARLSSVPNTALANPSVTLGATAVALGSTVTALQGITKLWPSADSTTALQVTKADGATAVCTFDTTNGALGIGSAPQTSASILLSVYRAGSVATQIIGDGGPATLSLFRNSTDALGASFNVRKIRGTNASPAAVVGGDSIGTYNFSANDTGLVSRILSSISATVGNVTGSNDISGYITISTRPDGAAAALTERLRVAAGVSIGAFSSDPGAGSLTVQNNVNVPGLPTADPHVVGRVWNNAGVMTVSAG